MGSDLLLTPPPPDYGYAWRTGTPKEDGWYWVYSPGWSHPSIYWVSEVDGRMLWYQHEEAGWRESKGGE